MPSAQQILYGVMHHAAVVDGKQMLVRGFSKRKEASAQPAGQNDTLHDDPSCSASVVALFASSANPAVTPSAGGSTGGREPSWGEVGTGQRSDSVVEPRAGQFDVCIVSWRTR